MGATLSNDSRSDIRSDQIKLKELNPSAIAKLKQTFQKGSSVTIDKKQAMQSLNISQRETDILFDYFDMDGDGQIDSYELTCAIAMLVHSSLDLRSEFLFKLYDFDQNNFLSRDEIIHIVRAMIISKGRPVIASDVESKADDFLRTADLDMDKKLSLKEFQSYAAKNRDVFSILDAYSPLLTNNPIGASSSSKGGKSEREKRNERIIDNDDYDKGDDDDIGGDFEEQETGEGDEGMDPDLLAELNKDKEANFRTEEQEERKKGVDYGNGFVVEETEEGDQFGALKPWLTAVVNTVPSNYKPSKLDGTTPDANLDLEFVHGYRCHDTRNNLRYTSNGEFVYHTAAVGIVYNKDEHKQKFLIEHFDDITALAIHPNKKIVATGEIGPYPLISIWDTESMETLVRIREPLQKGINHLAFSSDGKYLVATAADDDHNIAVFEWAKGKAEDLSQITDPHLRMKKGQPQFKGPVVGTCKGGRANILGVCFNKTGDTLACACVKEVNIIKITPGKMRKTKCSGLKGANLTSIMCCGYLKNTLICGSVNGKLLLFAGTSFTKAIKAHSSSMNSIWIRENDLGFLTGGNDGIILTWDSKYTITNRITIIKPEVHSLCPRVRSLCEDSDGNMLVGLRGGEILEIQNGTPKVYLRGHWDKELWGLCVHKTKDQFYTVGEDKLLGVWDIQSKELKQYCVLEEPATSIDISPNGKDLAIGCESSNLYIYDAETLKKKYMKTESVRKAIEDLKYSPDGAYLAVGGIDKDTDGFSHIFIYDCKQKYKRLRKLKGHTSRITHIDWSEDGEYLQSNSTSYELLFHSAETGTHITNISTLRDVDWHTWTCVLGWPVQGIWPPFAAGDDVNACDVDKTKKVIVTSDDYSKVKLFRYPSPVEKAAYNQYNGHSSHVTCVRFTANNKHVISTGGNDKAIFQFKFSFDNENGDDEDEEEYEMEEDEDDIVDDKNEYMDYKMEENPQGDEAGASKAWLGEMQNSSPKIKITKAMGKAPPENIKKLNYVFGYRAFDSRNNIKYIGDGSKIVYTTAALGIVLDKKTLKQKYFIHHNEDIVSLALHPNLRTVATGQMAAKGEAKFINLFVWDSTNLPNETNVEWNERENVPSNVSNLKGRLLRAIRILKFSPDGNKLVGNGEDDNNSIAVFDTSNVNKPSFVGLVKVDNSRVLDIAWINNDEFVSVGSKHIKYFKISGRNINGRKGNFGKITKEALVSVTFAFGKVFTGGLKGNIIKWEGGTASTCTNVCKNGPVYVLEFNEKLKLLFSGGFDGVIIAFDSHKLSEKYRIDIQKVTQTPTDSGIRAIDFNDNDEMVVGTKGGEIVEISLKTKQMTKCLMKSHYLNELWAVTVNPTNNNEFATGGGDSTLRIWDIKKHEQKQFKLFPEDFRAIDWSSDGKFIVIGSMQGTIYYVTVNSMKSSSFKSIFYNENKKKSDKDKWIQELKISPNNEYVAFGSHCGLGNTFSKIQVLQVTGNAKNPLKSFITIDPKITSALTHLDWGTDNDRIVCNSLAFELKYVSLGAKKVIRSSSCVYEDDMWHTWTCLFGFPVQGIWEPATTNYSVNYTCRSSSYKVLATGDDFSKVKLFKCPCVVEHAEYKAYGGHSSHIPKIRFTPNDKYLISVGGNDKSVFIWETDFGKGGEEEEENVEEEEVEEEPEPEPPKRKKKEKIEVEEEEEEPEPEPEPPKTKTQGKKKKQELIEEEEEEPEPEPPKKKKKGKKKPAPIEEEEEEPEPEPPKKKTKGKKKPAPIEEEEEEPEPEPPKKKAKKKKKQELIEEEEEREEEPEPPKKKAKKKKKQELIEEEEEPQNEEENNEEIEENVVSSKKRKKRFVKKKEEDEIEDNNEEEEQSKKKMKKSGNRKIHNDNDEIKISNNNMFNEELYDDIGTQAVNPNAPIIQNKDIPDNIEIPDNQKPNIKMKLDYVYGYRTKDTRNNVRYLDDKTIIYNAGKLCIIQNLENNTQRYFSGHRENVQCFTLNKERDLIASADGSNESMKSQIIVWDPNTFEVKIPIELDINGINCLHFSPNSSKLIAAGLDKDHSLLLINLSDGEILANTLCGKHKIVSCVFNNENEFATVGIKHCKFWTIQNEKELQFIDGEIDENVDKKLGVIEYCKNSYITGSSTGQIVIWQNGKSQNKKKIHDLPVDTLFTNEKYIISGGRDLCIIIMDYDLSELKKINLESLESSVIPNPRSIDVLDNVENKMLIGTISGEIMEFTFDKDIIDKDYNVELFNYSHFSTHSQENNEIISILYWKSKNLFISISEDCTIRIWNINENKQEKFIKLEEVKVDKSSNISEKKPKSADLSPNEEELIIGFSNGNIKKYSTNNFNETHKMSFNNNPISSIKYSPDGSLIALGTKDNDSNAFVLEIIKNSSNSLLYSIKGQNDSITKIDWSYDNQYIACVSQNNEVQIYSSKKGVLITKIDVVKNEEWKTWTRTFGWALNGYYEKGNSKITSCERYNKKMKNNKIIAIGNEKGEVRIYKYPVLSEEQEYCNGDYNHGDIVSNVKFALTNSDENGILFTSGNDGCIYKWILE